MKGWVVIIAIAGLALAASHSVAYFKGRIEGKAAMKSQWDAATDSATDKKLDIKGKQDAIQNAPVDVGVVARRLREGTF